MKKGLSTLFHFLGSLHFAIFLIATTALAVIVGTFLESKTDSHGYAAQFTFNHPFFRLLFWLFFVNILFSSLRRWPFKWGHVPFLTTHLGLLMILGGLLVKSYFGTQGNLSLMEGGETDQLLLPQTEVIAVEKRDRERPYETVRTEYALDGSSSSPFEELTVRLLHTTPHAEEQIDTWIQGDHAVIHGLPPLPVTAWTQENPLLQPAIRAVLPPSKAEWDVYAIRTDATESLLKILEKEQIPPSLVLIQDRIGDVFVVAFDPYGNISKSHYPGDTLNSVIVYDEGFGGYTVQTSLPLLLKNASEIEEERLAILTEQLRRGATNPKRLSPPLQLFWNAAEQAQTDFSETFVAFLDTWNQKGEWLYPESAQLPGSLASTFQNFDWEEVTETASCVWASEMLVPIEQQLNEGKPLNTVLEQMGWPLTYEDHSQEASLTQLTQQIFSVAEHLPQKEIPPTASPERHAHLFSAYLRAYELHLKTLLPIETLSTTDTFSIETPVHFRYLPIAPSQKMEENRPAVLLHVGKAPHQEKIALGYHPTGEGLKLPLLFGEYCARFQPKQITLPYKIRLRQARQVNYAHSTQPFSYAADIILTHVQSGQIVEQTISMNNVHETWEGYRFYLANLSSGNEGEVKRIQLIVNHDPAKYILTYPGGIVMVLGIIAFLLAKIHRPRDGK